MIDIPRIKTEHLILCTLLISDVPEMHNYLSKRRMPSIGGHCDKLCAWHALLSSLGPWHLRSFGYWHTEHREIGKIGVAGRFLHYFGWLELKFGWNVRHNFRGKSMANEAVLAARCFGETHLNLYNLASFFDSAKNFFAALVKRLEAPFVMTYCLRKRRCHTYRYPINLILEMVTQSETNE